ncbi:MAG: hypothetical protein HY078_00860 [Elusimicrobia bacterium]|nr:hypothetical protein [Elusimicrobiota bacterium]
MLRYPAIGQGLEGVPNWGRIGTLTLPTAASRGPAIENMNLSYDGTGGWIASEANLQFEMLTRAGYTQSKFTETIRPDPVAQRAGLEQVIRSTAAFETQDRLTWPGADFWLQSVHYSPLGQCAFAVFKRPTPSDSYRWRLFHTNTGARRTRARAHVTNGLMLFKAGDLAGGQAETQIAADMDPNYAYGRFYNAALLAALGRTEEAIADLKAAVAADAKLAEKAQETVEFQDLRDDPRFQKAVGLDPKKPSFYQEPK